MIPKLWCANSWSSNYGLSKHMWQSLKSQNGTSKGHRYLLSFQTWTYAWDKPQSTHPLAHPSAVRFRKPLLLILHHQRHLRNKHTWRWRVLTESSWSNICTKNINIKKCKYTYRETICHEWGLNAFGPSFFLGGGASSTGSSSSSASGSGLLRDLFGAAGCFALAFDLALAFALGSAALEVDFWAFKSVLGTRKIGATNKESSFDDQSIAYIPHFKGQAFSALCPSIMARDDLTQFVCIESRSGGNSTKNLTQLRFSGSPYVGTSLSWMVARLGNKDQQSSEKTCKRPHFHFHMWLWEMCHVIYWHGVAERSHL